MKVCGCGPKSQNANLNIPAVTRRMKNCKSVRDKCGTFGRDLSSRWVTNFSRVLALNGSRADRTARWGQEKDVRPFHFYYHDGQISFSIISLLLKFPFKQDAMNSLIVVHFPWCQLRCTTSGAHVSVSKWMRPQQPKSGRHRQFNVTDHQSKNVQSLGRKRLSRCLPAVKIGARTSPASSQHLEPVGQFEILNKKQTNQLIFGRHPVKEAGWTHPSSGAMMTSLHASANTRIRTRAAWGVTFKTPRLCGSNVTFTEAKWGVPRQTFAGMERTTCL